MEFTAVRFPFGKLRFDLKLFGALFDVFRNLLTQTI